MLTPAEIIAARVNGTYVEPESETVKTSVPAPSQGPAPSLTDESAFPVLGGGARSQSGSSAPSWGPLSNGTSTPSYTARASNNASRAPIAGSKLKSSSIQLAFSMDAEDQLNVARPDFIKILNSIKAATSASIECTTSQHTKRRTFLITAKPEQAKQAKRLVISKLTKPVVISFLIPAKVRSKVIGSQGRNLKPIIQENEVRVDIGHPDESESPSPDDDDDEDDVYAQTVKVTIEGDVEGCKQAKAQIMEIVNEQLKNSHVKVVVDEFIKPFVASALKNVVDTYASLDFTFPPYGSSSQSIIIQGDRAESLAAREDVKKTLSKLFTTLVVELIPIPKSKFSFIPIAQILEENNVLVELPEEEDSPVKFIGEKSLIAPAQAKVKSIISQYTVEVMDMGKAHKGNISHVRAVAAMFTKYGIFDSIASEYGLKINSPSLKVSQNSSLPIEIVVNADDAENTKGARRAIVSAVNKVTPDQTLEVSGIDSFFHSKIPEVLEGIEGARFVVLDDEKVVVFDYSPSGGDFDDFEEGSSSVLESCAKALESLKALSETLATVVLQVPSADQTHIIGPNESTLRSILASVEPKSVVLKLHSNASGSSDDEIFIKGLKAEVKKVQKDVLEIVEEAQEYSATGGYSTEFEVPTFVLSRVIGKGGSTLNSIRDEFGVKIDIEGDSKGSETADKSLKTQITLHGIKRNAESAKNAIKKLAQKLADDTLVRVRIESQYHRRIIGPNFSYINRLQDRYNVKIRFPSASGENSGNGPSNENEVTIRGPSKNVSKAEDELRQLYNFERENGFKATIKVPSKAMARVIGKNGSNINDISDGTGVDYRFNKDKQLEEENGYAEVELTGSKKALKEATEKIQEIIDNVENSITVTIKVNPKYHRDLVGPNGSVLREIISKAGGDNLTRQEYSRLLTIPNEGEGSDEVVCEGNKIVVNKIAEQIRKIVAEKEAAVTVNYDLAKEKHKLIIGPGGSIRKELQDEFNVQINIPRADSASTEVKLSGLPEKIEQLRIKLDELTKDNWNECIDVPVTLHALVSEKGALIKALRIEHNVEVSHGNYSRKASALSNASVPAPPEGAEPEEDAATNFVTQNLDGANEDDTIPWRLIGSKEATAKAAKIIDEQLQSAKLASTAGWFYVQNPAAHFPKIVGPQGSRVKKIRQSTGAFITVPRPNDKNNKFIYVVGTEDSLEKAKDELLKAIQSR